MMKISEIFKSIQGETAYAGLPCAFVRLTGCNLRCSWCDTAYAYSGGRDLPAGRVLEKVRGSGARLAAVTGGEPLLQREEVCALAEKLLEEEFTVLIETNGSLPVSGIPEGAVKIMDIKCPSSGMSDKNLWDNIECLERKDSVKFVLNSSKDYIWARGVIRKFNLCGKCEVLLSPVRGGGMPPADIADRMLADGLSARLQLQLHKILWGDDRRR